MPTHVPIVQRWPSRVSSRYGTVAMRVLWENTRKMPIMKALTTRQRNNLLVGNDLAVEIPALAPDCRAFVVIGAYRDDHEGLGGSRVSNYLNASDQEDVRFWFRKYEIETVYIENDWDVAESDLQDSLFKNDIASVEELEQILGVYLEDFSGLDVSWRHDNPV